MPVSTMQRVFAVVPSVVSQACGARICCGPYWLEYDGSLGVKLTKAMPSSSHHVTLGSSDVCWTKTSSVRCETRTVANLSTVSVWTTVPVLYVEPVVMATGYV